MDGADLIGESQAGLTESTRTAFDKFMSKHTTYSTQMLLLLAEWLDEQEDGRGSQLVLGFVDKFADHEAADLG